MFYKRGIALSLLFLVESISALEYDVNSTSETLHRGGSSRILSRRKRYLIFPDGSSFQLVFCTQNHGYLQIGDIVWFGTTAALAWELPTDPQTFDFKRQHAKDYVQNRDGSSKLIYFLDENGKIISKAPYKRKPLVNPAFAKRSVDSKSEHNINDQTIKKMHEGQKSLQHFQYLDRSSINFHREGRKSFYIHLEKFMNALGWNGRECVLRMLCEVGKGGTEQGTFLGEIVSAMFTLPLGSSEADFHKQYDLAHQAPGNCDKLYPCCEFNSMN